MAPRWEYHVEVLGSFWQAPRPEEIQAFLTQAAEDDWEPVELASIQNGNRLMLILRRSVQDKMRKRTRDWP